MKCKVKETGTLMMGYKNGTWVEGSLQEQTASTHLKSILKGVLCRDPRSQKDEELFVSLVARVPGNNLGNVC